MMISDKIGQISKVLNAELIGHNISFTGVSLDTRTLMAKNLFFAIKGPHFDGHDFASQAMMLGASALVVSHQLDLPIPQLIVKDTRIALGDLARYYRSAYQKPVVALTGSCGKTTTKMLITQILLTVGKVHATAGNYNNDFGVPLTLLAMDQSVDYAVIEMGANHPKEIFYLTHITKPTVALITNVGPVHLEGFKTIDGVAKAKGEIFDGLVDDGIALINADDQYAEYWISEYAGRRFVTFGLNEQADVYAKAICETDSGSSFELCTLQGSLLISLPLLGVHNIYNALAAASVAISLKVPLSAIKKGLETASAVESRFVEKYGINKALIIDDTYNSNPMAMEKALMFLSQKQGQRILVMGDMGELGEHTIFYHEEMGKKAKEYGIDALYAVGHDTLYTVKSFGDEGRHFSSHNAMIAALYPLMNENITVLIKGSRAAEMEKVVQGLQAVEK
jgi:UDP-N-acetylmuramoyl-tripeptide--D-alanyl-D-alanine ligase